MVAPRTVVVRFVLVENVVSICGAGIGVIDDVVVEDEGRILSLMVSVGNECTSIVRCLGSSILQFCYNAWGFKCAEVIFLATCGQVSVVFYSYSTSIFISSEFLVVWGSGESEIIN